MTLANGRHYLAIPGPSVVPDRILNAMHRASPNIYEGALVEAMPELISGLKSVARTSFDVAMYFGNGHAGWEAAIANTLQAGDRVLIPTNGGFADRWADAVRAHGVHVDVLELDRSTAFDPDIIETVLRADTAHEIKAVMAVHVDTSTSVKNDFATLRAAMDAAGHPALLMADCIASLGCDPFEMDAWGVDVVITASQKGLMMPPGLAFVFLNQKARAAGRNITHRSQYWDWDRRIDPEIFAYYFGGTAPTHHLYGLREALRMIVDEEGIEAVWTRHETLARAVWAAVEHWGQDGPMALHVPNPAHRGHSVTSLGIGAPMGTALRDWTETNMGVTLGIGFGMAPLGDPKWHGYFRIGHMGHVNGHMVMGTLGVIEAGMEALSIPFAEGGLKAARQVLIR
ncbi:MAG: pyridoxal-phosphate-dependent aminotransferase family protein [Halocynthiibacter sp.]